MLLPVGELCEFAQVPPARTALHRSAVKCVLTCTKDPNAGLVVDRLESGTDWALATAACLLITQGAKAALCSATAATDGARRTTLRAQQFTAARGDGYGRV